MQVKLLNYLLRVLNVYVRYAEEEVVGHHHFVMNFTAEELPSYRQREPKAE